MVIVRDGKIVAAGDVRMKLPAGTQVIDATGKWVTPGMVAGFSGLGLADVGFGAEGAADTKNEGPFSAAIDVSTEINPSAVPVAVNRADEVTRAIVAPSAGKSIFAGQGAVIDTAADMDPITAARKFQFVELGQDAAGQGRGIARLGACAVPQRAARGVGAEPLRAPVPAGTRATPQERERPVVQNPNESRIYSAQRPEDALLTRFDAAALVPVLQGRQYLLVHAERASDILQVIDLTREFPKLKIVLVGATEGWLVADQIAKSGIPVIAAAVNDLPASFEQSRRPSRTSAGCAPRA